MDQLVQADFQVARRSSRSRAARSAGDLGQERLEGLLDQELLDCVPVGQPVAVRGCGARRAPAPGRGRRSAAGRSARRPCDVCDDEQPAVEHVAAAVLDRGGEDVQAVRVAGCAGRRRRRRAAGRRDPLVRRPRAPPRTADGRGDPFERGVVVEQLPCRRRSACTRGPACRSGLQPLADGPEVRGTRPTR